MTAPDAIDLTQAALWTALAASAPVVFAVMIVGIVISIMQALTQIQEMTLTFVPKIAIAVISLAVSSTYIARTILMFTERSYAQIQYTGTHPDVERSDRTPVIKRFDK